VKNVGRGRSCNADIRFSSVVPQAATSTPITRKWNRHLRSECRWSAGTFSSSTNIESPERLVFDDEVGNRDGFGDGLLGNPAIPLAANLGPSQAALELIENNPYHDARAFERRLAAADFRVSHDVAAEFDAPELTIRLRLHASALDYAAAKAGLQDTVQRRNRAGAVQVDQGICKKPWAICDEAGEGCSRG
jgi:hypothetical protein